MQGEPAEPPPSSEDSDPMVLLLQRQMARLKRWFEWERWLLEPRSFAPPDDPWYPSPQSDSAESPSARSGSPEPPPN